MNRIIITGATGTIGMALINKCIESKLEVIALVNPNSRRLAGIPGNPLVRVIKCGLDDLDSASVNSLEIEETEPGNGIFADAFLHLAWGGTFGDSRNNKELQDKNISYALDAVGLAKRLGCSAFVGAGSQAEYGRVSGVLTPETPCNPENEYGRAKLRASEETRKLCREFGIRHIWTRILSIYGPYDGEGTMIMSVINKLLAGEKPPLTAGEQMWDYLYCSDAAKALLLLAEHGHDGCIYPIGSGSARPLREYIEIIRDEIDPKLPLGFGEVPYSDKQVMHLCADISKLRADTGFAPEVEFRKGIQSTIKYCSGL